MSAQKAIRDLDKTHERFFGLTCKVWGLSKKFAGEPFFVSLRNIERYKQKKDSYLLS